MTNSEILQRIKMYEDLIMQDKSVKNTLLRQLPFFKKQQETGDDSYKDIIEFHETTLSNIDERYVSYKKYIEELKKQIK